MKKDITFLVLGGISLIISLFDLVPLPFDAAWIAIIFCGVPIIMEAVTGLVTAFDIKADVLVSLALIASVCIGEDFAAGEVAFIMQLGALLEDLTVAKARAGIERLVHLTPQTARVIRDGREQVIPAGEVKVGDRIRVLPGETIAVDGEILSGQTSINQAVMTGESLPVDKAPGDPVSSGTVNQFGAFEMKATKVGEDSSIQRMIRLVQSAGSLPGRSSGRLPFLLCFVPARWCWPRPRRLWRLSATPRNMASWCGKETRWSGFRQWQRSPLTKRAPSPMVRRK